MALVHPAHGNSVMVTILVLSVFGFCLFRSIGVAALTSWIYAIVPVSVRGRYFASEQLSSGTAGALTLVLSALSFVALPFYPAILAQ